MLIAEFATEGGILTTALEHAPEMVLTNEEEYVDDDDARILFWAEGGEFDAFEAGLAADPTVTDPRAVCDVAGRRLYRVDLTDEGVATTPGTVCREHDIVLEEVIGKNTGWTLRLRVPDRESLAAYCEALRERSIEFELQALYHAVDAHSPAESALTSTQSDALLTAYEWGYYDVPRRTSQTDVADRLNISPQSLSERLRRGTATLIEMTLR